MAAKQKTNLLRRLLNLQITLQEIIVEVSADQSRNLDLGRSLKNAKIESDKVILPLTPEILSLIRREEQNEST